MIVNVGRAAIVDEDALWSEVATGRLHFASDVWWRESELGPMRAKLPAEFYGSKYPFHTRDNVVVSPHFAGGIGLPGIEQERAEAVLETIATAATGARRPCDLAAGY